MSIRTIYTYISILFALLLSACANRGTGPQGGPRDTIPPVVVKEIPINGTLNFSAKRIEIQFDEYIQLVDVQKNVLISPPQQTPPEVKAIGKALTITFQQPLLDSTTYTIDFGAAICDYNEKTPLYDYVYSFSTGDVIDSLSISGRVFDAATLNPVSEVLVGVHSSLSDTALSTLPFTRITRTEEDGYFTIHNLRHGEYRLYALNDISRDYLYQPGEALAFSDSIFIPWAKSISVQDTLWRDTVGIDTLTMDTLFVSQVDSVRIVTQTIYGPDSLVLWYFSESKQRHYFKGVYREEPHSFTLIFSAPHDTMPVIRPLRPSERDSLASDSAWVDWSQYAIVNTSLQYDTITYWLLDSLAIGQDSIYLEMVYQITDSLYNLIPQTDTILAVYRRPRMSEKAWDATMRKKRERKLEFKTNASSKFEIFDTLCIRSEWPIDSISYEQISLMHKEDTLLTPMKYQLFTNDSLQQKIYLIAALQPANSYVLTIDSAAIFDIYGKCNDSIDYSIKVKSLDEYSALVVKLTHYDSLARIQLLNEKDVVVRELPAMQEGTLFTHLDPTSYYLRMYIDYDRNGEWTTGDWLLHRQPEPIYYYPSKLKLRANWDFEEQFDHINLPQTDTKPQALISKSKKKK